MWGKGSEINNRCKIKVLRKSFTISYRFYKVIFKRKIVKPHIENKCFLLEQVGNYKGKK